MEIKMNELKYNIEKFRDRKGFWRDLIDNDTLVIISLLVIAIVAKDNAEVLKAIAYGFIGYMGGKK